MNIPILTGLAEIVDGCDLFIIDLWGVVHDGEAAFPDAIGCLRHLRQCGARIVLLSNAARLSEAVAAHLNRLGISDELYDRLLTSGDVTAKAMAAGTSGTGANARPACFHLGPARGRPTFDACGGRATDIGEAELIICTGLINDETERVEDYRDLLTAAADRGLPMICANPDVMVIRGGRTIYGAGALAALYEELGGSVRRFGKPHPAIFDQLFAESPDIPRSRAVMIGDSLSTDMQGARRAGIDALWIAGGIHAEALGLGAEGVPQPDKVAAVAQRAGEQPMAILPRLKW